MMKYLYLFISILFLICVSGATVVDFNNVTPNTSSVYALAVTFNSTTPTDPIISRVWDFGDNYTSTEVNPTHYYSVAGRYNVSGSFVNSTGITIVNKSYYVNLTSDYNSGLKSWMHFDGVGGGVMFQDEMGLAHTPNSVTTSNTTFKFGNTSGFFDANGDYITTPATSTTNLSTTNFTIEMWINLTSTSNNNLIVSKSANDLSTGWGIYHSSGILSNNWVFFMGGLTNQTSTFTIPLNRWNHLAVVRTNGIVNVYLNGSRIVSPIVMSDNYDTSNTLMFGDRLGFPVSFNGYLDEFRLSTGSARWESNFSVPTTAYKGDLFFPFPDINPGSTYRFKTDTMEIAIIANTSRGGTRNRTVQLQNVNNATYALGTMTFDPEHLDVRNVYPNISYYSDISVVCWTHNPITGVLFFNITRPSGFSNGINRASVLDTEILYWNYTPFPTSSLSFFGEGYLINGSTEIVYPVHNFIETVLTYGGWTTFGNFTVSDNTPTTFETPVIFIPELNYSANRFLWNFGDGNTFLSYNQTTTHIYNTTGRMNVTLTAYIWQNESVTNTTTLYYAVNASYNASYIDTDFTSNITTGYPPLVVQFNDTTIVNPDHWTWSFGEGNFSPLKNPIYIYYYAGNYTVELTSSNSDNSDNMTKLNYIWVKTEYPRSSIQNRMVDTQMYVYVGALLIIVLLIIGFITKVLLPNE